MQRNHTAAAAIAAAFMVSIAHAAPFTFTPLGDLPAGGFDSYGQGASGDGSIVTGIGLSASGYETFRRTSGGGMVGLGDLPGGSFDSYGQGISSDGLVIVAAGGEGIQRRASDRVGRRAGVRSCLWTPGVRLARLAGWAAP